MASCMSTRIPHRSFAACGLIVLLPLSSLAQGSGDLTTVEQRLEAGFLTGIPATATIQGYQSSLLADGSWSDITYSSTAQTNWAPFAHLERLGQMARAWAHPSGSLHGDATLLADILRAYDAWISRNPQSSNWWYNQIAVPQELGESMVLIKEQLSASRLNSGLSVLQRAYVARSTSSGTNTGQNRVDRAIAGIQRGIVAASVSITQDAFLAIADTILVTTSEGIQRDGSFHQHGAQLYNQGYGSLYLSGTLRWSAMAADTGFAFSEVKRRILTDYLLDGTRWMNRGQVIDYTASGRGISRKGQSTNASGLASLATTALQVSPGYREAELEALRASIIAANASGSADPALALGGGKHFWRSDLTVWHRPAAYASVKISSVRTLQPETGNGEGLKNYHLADGVNLIYRSGNEYDDIMPAWNWRKLPGTTVEQGTYSLKPSPDWGTAGTSSYAGGISDETCAGTAFQYKRRNVSARKAWFFFDDAFIALGADIDAPAATSQVETTLNQCLLNGPVTYGSGGSPQTFGSGSSTLGGLRWVHHDGIGYFFNQTPASATLQAASQSGTWQSINTGYDTTSVSKNVFGLSIRHGTAFSNGSYAYTVVPGLSAAEMPGWQTPIEVLRNDASAQAARDQDAGLIQAAFHAASSVGFGGTGSLSANSPSLLMIRYADDSLKVCAASPEAKAMSVQAQVSGLRLGAQASWLDALGDSTSLSFGLPGGDLAGSTVALRIEGGTQAEPILEFTGEGGFTSLAASFDAPFNLPADTTLMADAMTLSFTRALNGDASLTKTGTATLDLSGANTYTGGTSVHGGTVNVSNVQSAADGGWEIGPAASTSTTVNFLPGSTVSVAAGAGFRIANTIASGTSTQTLHVAGTVDNRGSLYLGRPGLLNLLPGGSWTQKGPASINGHGGYRSELSAGSGSAFIYDGDSSFGINSAAGNSGPAVLSIVGGSFTTSRGFRNHSVSGSGAAQIGLGSGGTLKISADIPALVSTAGSPFLVLLGNGARIDTNGFSTAIGVPLADLSGQTGSLTKNGAGTLSLDAANTYGGSTTVNAGTLRLGGSQGSGDIIVNFGGTLEIARGSDLSLPNSFSGGGRLVKSGTARLTLTGSQTRGGDTVIHAGTLALRSASLGDDSELSITSAAVLALEHTGTDTIRVLRFDGIAQAPGLWGAPGSGAPRESSRLSGSGLLQVGSGGFDLWLAEHAAHATGGEDGDPDGDGWANLFEYALGLDPASPNPGLSVTHGGNALAMSFLRHHAAPDVEVTAEWSDDLSEWSTEGITWDESAAPLIRITLPESGERRFLRLHARRR